MFNTFLFKKHNEQISKQIQKVKKRQRYLNKYQNDIRPLLLQRYGRRVNNFIVKLEEDKKQLYQYRRETQRKAFQLLKEIQNKEKYLGRPSMKMKDSSDWNSTQTAYNRFQKQKIKSLYQTKFGDQNIANRSIASQSQYYSTIKSSFRERVKQKQIHSCNMRFTKRQYSKAKPQKNRYKTSHKNQQNNQDEEYHHTTSLKSEDEHILLDHTLTLNKISNDLLKLIQKDGVESEHQKIKQKKDENINSNNKIYFKQVIDIYQNTKQKKAKRQLQQLLVRFGINRIKDIKKQALVQTDTLDDDLF